MSKLKRKWRKSKSLAITFALVLSIVMILSIVLPILINN